MTNKNHSKSDKKTRKYKQLHARLKAEVVQLNRECAEQSKKTDKKFEEVGEKIKEVSEQIKETGKEVKEVVEGLRQVRIASEKNGDEVKEVVEGLRQVRIASEKNGDEVKEVVEGLRQARIASEKNGDEVKEVVEGLRQVRIASEKNGDEVKEVVEGLRQARIGIENNGDQIGGLSNKFGGYTEAMARPAIRRILEERFHAHYLGPVRFKSTDEVEAVEVDAWGLSRNGTGTAYLVEIKSKFRDEHIEQVWKQVERFRIHYSAIWEQAVYPMLAVVDISDRGRKKVWNAGIHLIEIDDGVFQYAKPPKDFEADGYRGMRGVRKDVPHLRAVPG